MSVNKIPVLFVGGEGRSGSTVLAALLGGHDGLFPVGEFHGVWQAVRTNELCACGMPFRSCAFWSQVGVDAFGGWDAVDLVAMLRFDRMFTRHRSLHRVLVPAWRRIMNGSSLSMFAVLRRSTERCSLCRAATSWSTPRRIRRTPSCFENPARFGCGSRISSGTVAASRIARGKRDVARPEYAHHPLLSGTFMNTRSAWRCAVEWDARRTYCLNGSAEAAFQRFSSGMRLLRHRPMRWWKRWSRTGSTTNERRTTNERFDSAMLSTRDRNPCGRAI